MKKILFIIAISVSLLGTYKQVSSESIEIPDTAIRLRVIPNSNSVSDLNMKQKVKDYLEKNVYTLLEETLTIEEAQNIINSNLDKINKDIKTIFEENNYDMDFKIKFGSNYFPDKQYKSVIYKEGYYESLVIYIGASQGDNWWCVLFPPLCLLEADETENTSDVEYSFWVKEMLEKIF